MSAHTSWGRTAVEPAPAPAHDPVAEPASTALRTSAPEPGAAHLAPPPLPVRGADRSSRVRPYALTGGRTRFQHVLLVETLVITIDTTEVPGGYGALACTDRGMPEMRAIVELCGQVRSVAEISALLRMPLGVVRVLLSDLADQGRIRVYGTGHGIGAPDRALLERVLRGLQRL